MSSEQHPVVGAEGLGGLRPVLALAEESVAEDDAGTGVAELGAVQAHPAILPQPGQVAATDPSWAGWSSAVSGWAMSSSDWPSALTPRKISMTPPAIISAAPMK